MGERTNSLALALKFTAEAEAFELPNRQAPTSEPR